MSVKDIVDNITKLLNENILDFHEAREFFGNLMLKYYTVVIGKRN